MAKIISKGLLPPEHPIFSGGVQVFTVRNQPPKDDQPPKDKPETGKSSGKGAK